MKHVIIGTAGHVDHGKTLLIKALTGIDTDRLIEEKKRGITIELGFAHIEFDNGLQAGIVDVPGHEKFIKNMLAGAGGIDLAMLVVAADEGFMPQTIEHLDILSLLHIKDGIVVITKTDLVEPDWLEIIRDDVAQHVKGTFLEGKPVLEVSAYTGQGLPELKEKLALMVENAAVKNTHIPFRMPIDRVFSVDGFGTVVTGTMIEGHVSVGDMAELMPSETPARIRTLQVHGKDVNTAYAGQRVAVNLAGLKKSDLDRGDTLCCPGSMHTTLMLDVKLHHLKDSHRVITNNTLVHLYHGSRVLLSKIVLLDRDELQPGESCYAQLRLTEPMAAKRGDSFVIRFYSPMETIGGGTVLHDHPVRHKRRDAAVLEMLKIQESGSSTQLLLHRVEERGCDLPTAEQLAEHTGMDVEGLREDLLQMTNSGQLLEIFPGRYLAITTYRKLCETCRQTLGEYHAKNPLQAGMKVAELRQKAFRNVDIANADGILSAMCVGSVLSRIADRYALPTFHVVLTKQQQRLRDKLLQSYRSSGIEVPFVDDLYATFSPAERAESKRVLENLVSCGELVMLSPQLFLTYDVYTQVTEKMRGHFASNEKLTLAEFRDLLSTSRKYALAILEYFDKNKITKKVDDYRILIDKNFTIH